MKSTFKYIFKHLPLGVMKVGLFLLLPSLLEWTGVSLFSQVVINEVMHKPSGNQGMMFAGKEYVEIYNNSCQPVNIGCYFIANRQDGGIYNNSGGFKFPTGTILGPYQHTVVGTQYSSVDSNNIDFNTNNFPGYTCNNYTGAGTGWLLGNIDGWVALYNPSGIPVDAIYWTSNAGEATKITTLTDYDDNPCLPPGCTGTFTVLSAKQIYTTYPASMAYVGQAVSTNLTFSRIPDGGAWQRNMGPTISNTAPTGNCNGSTCSASVAFSVDTTSSNATCGASNGSATATPNPAGAYTYLWSNPTASTTATATGLSAGTYYVTVTNASGCVVTDTAIVVSSGGPGLTTSVTPATCGLSNGTAAAAATGGSSPYSYLWSGGGTTSAKTGLAAGNYSVTVTDAAGCSVIATAIVPGSPGVTVSVTPATCSSSNGTATANPSGGTTPYSYLWSTSPAQTTITATGLASGSYSVTVTDSSNCSATATAIVTGGPTVIAGYNPSSCGLSNGSASVTVNGGATPYSYLWSTTPPKSTQTVTGLTAGNYTITVTDANSCTATANININNISGPALTISVTMATCNSANGSATANPAGGTSPFYYLWNTVPVQNTQTATGLAAGSYTLTVTDDNNCAAIDSVTLNASAIFNVSVTATNVLCNGDSTGSGSVTVSPLLNCITLQPDSAVGKDATIANCIPCGFDNSNYGNDLEFNAIAWTASGNNSDSRSLIAFNLSVIPPGSMVQSANLSLYFYSSGSNIPQHSQLSGTNDAYLQKITNAWNENTVTWNNQPAITTVGQVYLPPSTNSTQNYTNINVMAMVQNFVDIPVQNYGMMLRLVTETKYRGIVFASSDCPVDSLHPKLEVCYYGQPSYTYLWSNGKTTSAVTGLKAGTYTVTVTDSNGCSKTDSVTVTEPIATTTTITSTQAGCGISNGTATVTPSGGAAPYTYKWSTSPVKTDSTATGLAAGNYTVTVTDNNNCTVTATVNISNSGGGGPPLTLSAIAATCGLNNGKATVVVVSGNSPYSYLWSNGNTNSAATPVGSGSYTVTVTDSSGCISVDSINVAGTTAITLTSTFTNVTCYGDSNGTMAVSVVSGSSPYSYLWNNGATQSSIVNLKPSIYTVTVTDSAGCTKTQTFTITEPVPLDAAISGNASVCSGISTLLTATPAATYKWSNNATTASITVSPVVSTKYFVTVTTGACSDVDSVTVSVSTAATANAGNDTAITVGSSTQLIASAAATYKWSTGETSSMITVSPKETTAYYLTVTNTAGCVAVDTVTVTVDVTTCNNYVPSLFTPNGDGVNDILYVRGAGLKEMKFLIYDRWGEKVFESTEKSYGWDGTFMNNGKAMDAAVFVYFFEAVCINGKTLSDKGNITLVK